MTQPPQTSSPNMARLRKQLAATLDNCADEPIRIPGFIQPYGALLLIHRHSLEIHRVSANLNAFLSLDSTTQILGAPLSTILPPALCDTLQHLDAKSPHQLVLHRFANGDTHALRFFTCEHSDWAGLEIEPHVPAIDTLTRQATLADMLSNLHTSSSLQNTLEDAVQFIRYYTGFDRVMVYRFDPKWNGHVCAEARADHLEPFLGLHYPHTDIPSQARALYMEQLLRLIPDINYQPVPLEPHAQERLRPSDLSRAMLRSVSPIHVEYLQNMGVAATLVISLRVRGTLWGLIACHHDQPKHLPVGDRTNLQLVAEALANQIALQLVAAHQKLELNLAHYRQQLWRTITHQTNLTDQIIPHADILCEMVGAEGLLITIDGHRASHGHVPALRQAPLVSMARAHLAHLPPGEVLALETLPEAAAAQLSPDVSGVLLARLDNHTSLIAFTRREAQQTIRWAGRPSTRDDASSLPLSPRRSFAVWEEHTRGRAHPWSNEDVHAANVIAQDLTRLVHKKNHLALLEEARQLELQLKEAQRLESLGVLAGGFAHDFNNILTGVIANLSLIHAFPNALDIYPNLITDTEKIAHRAADLAKKLLTFAQQTPVHLEQLDLASEIDDLHAMLRAAIPSTIELHIRTPIPTSPIQADRVQLSQVILNLVVNAAEAYEDAIGTVSLEVDHQTLSSIPSSNTFIYGHHLAPGPFAVMTVIDHGVGMTHTTLAKIFDPFFSTKFTGRGLGLAALRGIVHSHDGAICVESTPGKGSRFQVWLPLLTKALVQRPSTPQQNAIQTIHHTVLVIEDEPDVRHVLERTLTTLGANVVLAADGASALLLLQQRTTPSVAIVDLTMPHMDSHDLLETLHQQYPDMALIATSGHDPKTLPDLPPHVSSFLPKPFSFKQLIRSLTDVLPATG